MTNKMNIAIIGYGRFGSLLAKLLRPYGRVFVLEKKNIRFSEPKINFKDLKEMDLVVPAVPISKLEQVLKQIDKHLKPGAIVMDVASVKVLPCRWLKSLRQDIEVIGCHPMFGPDSAVNGLKGLLTVLCPVRIGHDNLKMIKDIWTDIGVSVMVTTPEQHDREAAKSLSLVHFLGRGLTKLKVGPQTISTLGFERLLKVNETVENDTLELFHDMHRFNPFAEGIRADYLKALQNIDSDLDRQVPAHDLKSLRQKMDKVDNRLAALLKERTAISEQIGCLKQKEKRPVRDLKREEAVIGRVAKMSGLKKEDIKNLYKQLFIISRKHQ